MCPMIEMIYAAIGGFVRRLLVLADVKVEST
jgi:hypothetical protein